MRRHSPYEYALNNPIRFTYPTGMAGKDTVKHLPCCVVVTDKSTSSVASKVGNFIIENLPFVGSGKQLYEGIRDGDWKKATLGAVFLTVDVFTAGEGGEGIKLAEEGLEEGIKLAEVGAEDEFKEGAQASIDELRAAGEQDAHHIIQDAAVRDLPGYKTGEAPGIQLDGPARTAGTPHNLATVEQRVSNGLRRGTYARERVIAYKALKKAGYSEAAAKRIVRQADGYFKSIGVNMKTVTRIPGR